MTCRTINICTRNLITTALLIPIINYAQAFRSTEASYGNFPVNFHYNFREFEDQVLLLKATAVIKQFSKYNKPPFLIKNAAFYNPALYFNKIDTLLREKWINLNSLHYYIDPKSVRLVKNTAFVKTTLPYEYVYQPFYLLNAEVTNAEYREFVYYVRDSIARQILADSKLKIAEEFYSYSDSSGTKILKWKKKVPYGSGNDEVREVLEPLYLPEGERFHNRREINARKLNYSFWQIEGVLSHVINIIPDTLCWVHDIVPDDFYRLEQMMDLYNWHPAYDYHPVVGLTYYQAKAFLIWKTRKLQKELDEKKIPLVVEFDLPNEVELEMVSVLKRIDSKWFSFNYQQQVEVLQNYDLDLALNTNSKISLEREEKRSNVNLTKDLARDYYYKGLQLSDMVYPASTTIPLKNFSPASAAYFDNFINYGGIPFLNGNVSEWMSENFSNADSSSFKTKDGNKSSKWANHLANYSITFPIKGNFEDSYRLYKKLTNSPDEFDKIKYQLIDSNFVLNDVCKLVRGANWFDPGDWTMGHLKKTFAPKDSTYSTVGFRYVVRFKSK